MQEKENFIKAVAGRHCFEDAARARQQAEEELHDRFLQEVSDRIE